MGKTEELWNDYLIEAASSSAHIECTITGGLDGKIIISASGHKAALFCCACEILKKLAQSEDEDLDMQKRYLGVVCETVLSELKERR